MKSDFCLLKFCLMETPSPHFNIFSFNAFYQSGLNNKQFFFMTGIPKRSGGSLSDPSFFRIFLCIFLFS
jgi:hypothetical protein